MGHDRIASNVTSPARFPCLRSGRDCPRGNEPLAPSNRCLAPDLRPWPVVAYSRRILVRHFERIVARNKLIIIVIEIFLVPTSTPRGYLSASVNYGDILSSAFYLLTLFRPLDARPTEASTEYSCVALIEFAPLADSPFSKGIYWWIKCRCRENKSGGMEVNVSRSMDRVLDVFPLPSLR